MSNYNRQHAADFAEWRIRHPHEVVNTPEEAGITSTLKVGDKVTFTNGYGVKFPGHRVLGFCNLLLAIGVCISIMIAIGSRRALMNSNLKSN